MSKATLAWIVMGMCTTATVEAQNAPVKLGKARIAGVDVSGLTPQDARKKLLGTLAPKLKTPVKLTDGVKVAKRTRGQLGVRLDVEGMVASAKTGQPAVPLRFRVDTAAAQKAIRSIASKWNFAGKNATVAERNGRIQIVREQYARTINVGKSAQDFAQAVAQNAGTTAFRLTVEKKPPKVTRSALQGITGRIGSFTTRFNPRHAKRTTNIKIAVKAIDGTLVPPTGIFSLNDIVGERTQARGYRTAPVYENGKLVPGIGGGVSQVTGTLFNAALLAGLKIIEYGTHAKPVAYIPLARDATVAWKQLDMKFKNNTDAPVLIQYRISGGSLTARLYGKKTAGQKVSLKVNVLSRGTRRITAELYRTIKQGGKVVLKEKVGTSYYRWKPQDNAD